ncbi:Dna Helicase Mcm8 [Manis pentadactyla]|nr:Dna Helicase Mcm8 [Manis pentadactyla]
MATRPSTENLLHCSTAIHGRSWLTLYCEASILPLPMPSTPLPFRTRCPVSSCGGRATFFPASTPDLGWGLTIACPHSSQCSTFHGPCAPHLSAMGRQQQMAFISPQTCTVFLLLEGKISTICSGLKITS